VLWALTTTLPMTVFDVEPASSSPVLVPAAGSVAVASVAVDVLAVVFDSPNAVEEVAEFADESSAAATP
jgi:hypothetical protein